MFEHNLINDLIAFDLVKLIPFSNGVKDYQTLLIEWCSTGAIFYWYTESNGMLTALHTHFSNFKNEQLDGRTFFCAFHFFWGLVFWFTSIICMPFHSVKKTSNLNLKSSVCVQNKFHSYGVYTVRMCKNVCASATAQWNIKIQTKLNWTQYKNNSRTSWNRDRVNALAINLKKKMWEYSAH